MISDKKKEHLLWWRFYRETESITWQMVSIKKLNVFICIMVSVLCCREWWISLNLVPGGKIPNFALDSGYMFTLVSVYESPYTFLRQGKYHRSPKKLSIFPIFSVLPNILISQILIVLRGSPCHVSQPNVKRKFLRYKILSGGKSVLSTSYFIQSFPRLFEMKKYLVC